MNFSSWFAKSTWRLDRYEWACVIVASFATGLIVSTAWAAATATLLLLFAPIALLLVSKEGFACCDFEPVDGLVVFVIGYAAVSTTWAADAYYSARAFWPITLAMGIVVVARNTFPILPHTWLGHLGRAAVVAYCATLTFLLIEETTDHALKRVLFWPFQAIHWSNGGPVVDWQHVSRVVPYQTNRNVMTAVFLIWPVLLLLRTQIDRGAFKAMRLLLLVAVTATVAQSHHQAAIVALIVGAATFGIARLNLNFAVVAVAVFWIASFVAAVPVAQLIYKHGWHTAETLQPSFRHRVVFWKYTADRILERPTFGVGLGSTQPLNEARKHVAETVPGTSFLLETGVHPHSIYLQVLYELGIIGAALVLVLGLGVIRAIHDMSLPMQAPYMLALFASWSAQSAFSFGLAEAWFIFVLVFAICLSFAAAALQRSMQPGARDLSIS